MKLKFFHLKLLCGLLYGGSFFSTYAQTGPGGVGSSATNKIWLDASYLTGITDGSKLSTVADRSGNGWNAIQNVVSYRPTYLINQLSGKPVIHFDRSVAFQYLEMTSPGIGSLVSNSHSLFIVAKASTGALNNSPSHIQVLLTTSGTNSTVAFSGYPNASGIYMHNYVGTGTDYISKLTSYTQGNWQLINRVMTENASGTTLTGYVNGASIGSSTSPLQIKNYANVIRLGASSPSGTYPYPLNGDIAEIIAYNTTLNDAQRVIVENYLAAKYNLAILNDKYVGNDAPFTMDVAGIGTSDGTVNNKHAVASNSKGLGLTEASSSLDVAEEYLFAGHASVGNSIISVDLPANIFQRWERSWYIEKTGSIDAKLTFDFGGAGLVAPTDLATEYGSYKLLFRSTATGTFTIVSSNPILENNDQLSFTLEDAQLLNGYYTLGNLAEFIWTGAQDLQWNNPTNWNVNSVPTAVDRVVVNACNTCPSLNTSVTIGAIKLNAGSKITLGEHELSIEGNSVLDATHVESSQGKIRSIDFIEIKNSVFSGAIVLEKTGGTANACYGGNTLSSELKIVNSSNSSWQVASQSNNVISK